MTEALLYLGRRPELTQQLLPLFRSHPSLELYTCQSGAKELEAQIQYFSPHLILIDAHILTETDANEFQQIFNKTASPPILLVYRSESERQQVIQIALGWGASDIISLQQAQWEENLLSRIFLLLPLGRQTRKARGTRPLPNFRTEAPRSSQRLLIIGASTGGPPALAKIMSELPLHFQVPILIVQHISGQWTQSLSERLNELSPLTVRQARPLDRLFPGQVLVVPGDQQVAFQSTGTLTLYHRPGLNAPSVDLALRSAVDAFGSQVSAVILTGMGQDGLEGVKKLKQAGGFALAEHASSCVVYGMPRAIIEAGLADRVVPISRMAQEIQSCLTPR